MLVSFVVMLLCCHFPMLLLQSEGDMQPPTYSDLPSLITSYIHKGEKNGLVCALRKPISPEGAEILEADSGMMCCSDIEETF